VGFLRGPADTGDMKDRLRILRHLGPPILLAVAFLGIYQIPREAFGCANRGLVGLGLIALSFLGAVVMMDRGVRGLRSRDGSGALWFLTAVALLLPSLVVVSVEIVLASR
jgi:hypothetical protein